jgi:Bacterial conjugation TrbI-like protein
MKLGREFFTSPRGQLVLVGALVVVGLGVVQYQHRQRQPAPLPAAKASPPAALPKAFSRDIAKFPKLTQIAEAAISAPGRSQNLPATDKPRTVPLTLFAAPPSPPAPPAPLFAPFGRLIPCETVVTLESNRLDTPVIALVTEDVWHDGRLIVPAGAEVHGRAALDRARERLAAQGAWRIVWRTPGTDNGTELAVQGLALDRQFDSATGRWGEQDGSAGLRGVIVKTDDERELKLFAATFLSGATAALQDTRVTGGLLGEVALPAATARNAVLGGASALLRDYAQQLREAVARDGLYVRVPSGKPFYLYVTETLDRRRAQRAAPVSHAP